MEFQEPIEVDDDLTYRTVNSLVMRGDMPKAELRECLAVYNQACHQYEEGCFIVQLRGDEIEAFIGSLSRYLTAFQDDAEVTVIVLKALLNTACIHKIVVTLIKNTDLQNMILKFLFSSNLEEKEMAIVFVENVFTDMNLMQKGSFEDIFQVRQLLSVDQLQFLVSCQLPFAKRCFKDLLDIFMFVTFSLSVEVDFLLNYCRASEYSEFTRYIFKLLNKIIGTSQQMWQYSRQQVCAYISTDTAEILDRIKETKSVRLKHEFLCLLQSFFECQREHEITYFLLNHDVVEILYHNWQLPLQPPQKESIAEIIMCAYGVNNSVFESTKVPKAESYAYVAKLLCGGSAHTVLQLLQNRSCDIAKNYPEIAELTIELINAYLKNDDFCELSLSVESNEYLVGQKLISLIASFCEYNEFLKVSVQQAQYILSWLDSFKYVNNEQFDITTYILNGPPIV